MSPDGDELLTPAELAEWLKIPVATLYGWRYRAEGPPSIKVGRHLRYRRSAVDRWLDGQTKHEADR